MSKSTQTQDLPALLNAAAASYMLGRLQEAAALYSQAAAVAPRDLRPIYSLAMIDIKLGHLEGARARLQTVLDLDPRHFAAQQNVGAVCQNLNRWQEAADAYRRALALNPTAVETHFSLARALAVLGQVNEAGACYRALAGEPSVRLRALTRLAVLDPSMIGDADLAWLRRGADDPASVPNARIEAYFALGQVLEQRGADREAFAALVLGNRLKHDALAASALVAARPETQEREHEQAVKYVIDRFDEAFFSRAVNQAGTSAAPIFIVGMPRCGSTLLEQILSSHSQVQSLGESAVLSDVIDRGFADAERSGNWRASSDRYLELMRRRGWQGVRHFVDKTLENHLRVGMIHLMFPKAVILDCWRDPVDTCVACYRQLFTEGNETLYDLAQIGRAYVRYRHVMEHWDRVLPGRVFRVEHEKLVADPEVQIRRLVTEVCSLDWEPDCLKFHESPGSVRTASAAQVRRPIFTTSIGRWRRYADELGPLFEALGSYAKGTVET
ncbi:MAG TPA: sulfotransferase [Steroidobacteraceae bacterium]|jgi:tetratricopeptide (TPR) repeat protein